ncbi:MULTISPECIES: preprotein translocase subunit SecA [Thermoanaerobacter]|uniref:Protein translocase subunit SecA n=2 Tax=Thermoanaerobacter TaxID=1754 RepID=B0KBU7_THEP3|nr:MULTISPECIES: preprotein translocase subunit SecA [Thermoanaerobacter]ABY95392.1 preprotein translocase, SecA subunit [Thermoanaerobacter pseudethanolicus ATCC 33223]ADV80335.1 preprotein translocase, SecA subunit [Thermoanaerobacter brockii subsp. finnii Ako-1]HBW59171.1 preprotein translocase subunit SecA [Thermoanaerobacter sp.]
MLGLVEKIFGSYSEREVKRLEPIADKVLSYEDQMARLTDAELRAKTDEFKNRLKNGETLDDILPEAFAVVREAAWRTLKMKHFRVQVIGGIVLHQGRIAEMKTGEGKTLVATLPAYLNALEGKGVHIVTVNDYLAKRDRDWMGKIYEFLGLSVGVILHDMDPEERKKAYAADITYGTNNEFGFDYLRDNMVIYKEDMVQRELNYAIVDEVDSILIDEARTPLIISGIAEKSTDMYKLADRFVRTLRKDEDYVVDEKAKAVSLTEKGIVKAEKFFGIKNLADIENMEISHHINQALKAHAIMKRDIDYVVKDGQVIIVDEFTGRLMFGRRYSEGLHQAIEAKEGVKVERESKTLATITFQNYFRMYKKLAGMTGTAQTEEQEFRAIYGLDVVVIPTNKPMIRIDHPDVIYKTEEAKFKAVVEDIVEHHKKGQPVLVGTISIEKSEKLSAMLKKRGIPHQVLNAKYHEKEAEIIAQAGRKGAVTIATNMAGRGTDILLGGNPEFIAKKKMHEEGYSKEIINEAAGYGPVSGEEVKKARERYFELLEEAKKETEKEHDEVVKLGGLYIIGTERHEARRIDNQLRGRAGRQGDPGESRFYISLEDDLMRLFGSERVKNMMDSLGIDDDQPIEHKILTKQIEQAQKKVEGINFDTRKHVLQYDDVMNKQREIIYAQRRKVLEGENLKESILEMVKSIIERNVEIYTAGSKYPEEWDIKGLLDHLYDMFLEKDSVVIDVDIDRLDKEVLTDIIYEEAVRQYEKKEAEIGPEQMREIERIVLLRVVDTKWMDHIDEMDQLRQGIGLRAYGQVDPLIEYKKIAFDMFEDLIQSIQEDTVKFLYHIQINKDNMIQREQVAKPISTNVDAEEKKQPVVKGKKVGRNDPCPCGSGKKYKKCCGANIKY